MKITYRIVSVLLAASLFIVLFFTAFQLGIFNMNYIDREMEKFDIADQVAMTDEDLHDLFSETLDYLSDDREDLVIDTVVAGESREAYGDREKIHMVDVKVLFDHGFLIRNISLVIVVLSALVLIVLGRKGVTDGIRITLWSIVIVWSVILLIFVLLIVLLSQDFDKYFVIFHEIFFDNDYWILDPAESLMINMLPEAFFYDTVMRIARFFAVPFVLIYGFGIGYLIRNRKHKRIQR